MVTQVISIGSMSALLQSFAAVLDEFDVSYGWGKNAAHCTMEGLLIVLLFLSSCMSTNSVLSRMDLSSRRVCHQTWPRSLKPSWLSMNLSSPPNCLSNRWYLLNPPTLHFSKMQRRYMVLNILFLPLPIIICSFLRVTLWSSKHSSCLNSWMLGAVSHNCISTIQTWTPLYLPLSSYPPFWCHPRVLSSMVLQLMPVRTSRWKKKNSPSFFCLFDNIVHCDVPLWSFVLTSMPDNTRANECVWIPHSFQHP